MSMQQMDAMAAADAAKTKKRVVRSEEQKRADLEAELAALSRKADVARLKATEHGKRLYRARTELVALEGSEADAEGDMRDALACVNAAIERCLAVVRGEKS